MDNADLRNYAYLGDAVWELFVRNVTVSITTNPKKLHSVTIAKVNASFQHELLEKIHDNLSEDELEIVRRARNLPVPIARRNNQAEYRMATAFEALVGWWYLTDKDRLDFALEFFKSNFPE